MSARCDKTRLFKASFSFQGVLFLAVLASSLLSACADRPLPETVLSGETMGTTYSVKYINQPGEANSARTEKSAHTEEEVAANVARLLTHLDKLLSTYQQESELNQLNRAEVGVDVPVSSILWQVLLIADQTYRDSNGAFDPSVGPLVDLWGFGPTAAPDNVPPDAVIESLLIDTGFKHLDFEPNKQAVVKRSDIRLDLSAVAKGYAADRVAELLFDMGLQRFMVEVGGELRLAGTNGRNQPWRIAIEVPELLRGGVQEVVVATDVGVATSGDYRNYFERDGVRYSHTIDPRTGRPIRHNLASATVIAGSAARADALATAFMVLGTEQSLALANRNEIAVYLISRGPDGWHTSLSKSFETYLQR